MFPLTSTAGEICIQGEVNKKLIKDKAKTKGRRDSSTRTKSRQGMESPSRPHEIYPEIGIPHVKDAFGSNSEGMCPMLTTILRVKPKGLQFLSCTTLATGSIIEAGHLLTDTAKATANARLEAAAAERMKEKVLQIDIWKTSLEREQEGHEYTRQQAESLRHDLKSQRTECDTLIKKLEDQERHSSELQQKLSESRTALKDARSQVARQKKLLQVQGSAVTISDNAIASAAAAAASAAVSNHVSASFIPLSQEKTLKEQTNFVHGMAIGTCQRDQ